MTDKDRISGYRERAQNALSLASLASDQDIRLTFVELAAFWSRLAEVADQNDRLRLAIKWPTPVVRFTQETDC